MTARCVDCNEEVRQLKSYMESWQSLFTSVLILETEENITPATSEQLQGLLCWIKAPLMKADGIEL